MKTRLINIWDALHSSFWFVPSLMAIGSTLLALLGLWLDEQLDFDDYLAVVGIYKGGADGAQTLLSTVAASMITVTGVTFSITIVALQLASSQFGPRLLRTFMQDTGTQIVLGAFLATFLYCIVILQAVSGEEDTLFVPRFSITVAMLLTMVSLGLLIYFIHNVASSIQVENVVAGIGTELDKDIDRLYPGRIGKAPSADRSSARDFDRHRLQSDARPVYSRQSGYIRTIDGEKLIEIAEKHDVFVEVQRRPGHYVLKGSKLFAVSPESAATDELCKELLDLIVYGRQRTGYQDVEFSVNQLVEIAVRALSTGINDPFTAMACVDRLGAALVKLAERGTPDPVRTDEKGRVRAIMNAASFAGVVDGAFDQIRQNAADAPAVLIRMLERLADIAERVSRPTDSSAIVRHAVMIREESLRAGHPAPDQEDIERRYQTVLAALPQTEARPPDRSVD